ncbi:DUF2530 domain-containing protein [Sanguibacter sp. 25GB23B1]|uniref:DUF2530 domain-containing protein n=1 Tax=unclassified Sanguibacter TaxID=2645534 RepID=UPI0032AF30F0
MPHLPPAIELTLHPERRRQDVRPVDVDLRVVILVGLASWGVAAAVFGALAVFSDLDVTAQVLVCAAGLSLGVLGLLWEHSNRRRYRPARDDIAHDGPGHDAPGHDEAPKP